jgi:uncharacterized protein DUF4082
MAESFYTDADLSGASAAFDAAGVTLGGAFAYPVGTITHVRFRATPTLSGGTYEGGLYRTISEDPPSGSPPRGALLNSAVFGTMTADAWNLVRLPVPPQTDPDETYRAAVYSSVGRYMALGSFYSAGNITRGNILGFQDGAAPPGLTSIRNGTFFYAGALTYPQDAFNAAAYFVDTVFEVGWRRVTPTFLPDLSSLAGLYAFGVDVQFTEAVSMDSVWWYQPAGTIEDVAVTIYDQATQIPLATGTGLAASLAVGWNRIPVTVPATAVIGTTYTFAAQTDGTHGYTNSVSLPIASPDGLAELVQTRYESGGGYPATDWGSGRHGVDAGYQLGGAPAPAEGTLAGNLNLAAALTGDRASAGALAGALNLQAALTGDRASAGALAGALNLQAALTDARPSAGALATVLDLAPSITGARTSLGSLAAGLNLAPALIGTRTSRGTLAASITLSVALTGSDGQSGRDVRPYPYPPGPVTGFPWPPRPVKSFQEVAG